MDAARFSVIIGIGAIIYLGAILASPADSFDYSLALVVLSPVLMVICAVGMLLAIRASVKNRRAGITDNTTVVGIILNAIGILGPFFVPLVKLI